MTERITRALAVETVTDERTFTGLAAPFNEVIEVNGQLERIEAGAFATAIPVKIYYNHLESGIVEPVGVVERYEESDAGLVVTARLYETPLGDAAYASLKTGDLDSLSIHAVPTAMRMDGDVLVYESLELFEISIVDQPAYPSAKVSVVRNKTSEVATSGNTINKEDSKESIMENEVNIYDDSELRTEVADIRRMLEVASNKEEDAPVSTIKSFGEYVQRYAAGDEEAHAFKRAYSGGTTADSVIANGWTKDIIKVVNNGRSVFNAFSKGQWVEEGNNIEYAKLNTNTIVVSSQAGGEGEALPFGKVSVTTAYAPKLTRGGYTEMSLQEIKRSNVNILGVAFEAMAAEYARATEADARAALAGAGAHEVAGASVATFDGWVDFLVDAAVHLDGKGLAPEFVVVSQDVYKELAGFSTNSNYFLNRVNGSVNVTGLDGNILSLPLVVIPGTGIATVAHSSAIKTFEAPGAPFNLQDENILNLTKQFSIWGEVAVAVQDADALVVVGA